MFIFALIIYTIVTFVLISAVTFFETDCKKIIFWNLVIIPTSILGFIVYAIFFCDKPMLKRAIKNKFEQDEIYKNLINFSLSKTSSGNETLNFNKRHYKAEIFKNSDIEVIENIETLVNSVSTDLDRAKDYVIVQNEVFLSMIHNENIISLLKEKQSMGVDVRCVYGRCKWVDRAIIKDLRANGVRVNRFNKKDKFNKYYKNTKNLICIDGEKAYLYNHANIKAKDTNAEYSTLFYKITGEVLKSIDMDAHMDVSFATQKVYELQKSTYQPVGEIETQYVASIGDMDFEGLLLKAINDAKKRIIIHLSKFVPTPAIRQALNMANMSGIDVKIMLSKTNRSGNYYSSRAYLKEMAMYGATSYLFDGVICSNFIVIDNLTLIGNFSLANLEIRNNLQNVLIVNNQKFAENTVQYYNKQVNNSYRICKPKNTLLREKIFKKFN